MNAEDHHFMRSINLTSGLGRDQLFDINRQVRTVNTDIGGVTITLTAIETRSMDIQQMQGEETVMRGGLRIEAQYRFFTDFGTDVRETDVLTPDSGTTEYEATFVEDQWSDHIEILAKRRA